MRAYGSADGPADRANRTGHTVHFSKALSGAAWVNQEHSCDGGRGFGDGAKASKGVGTMSKKKFYIKCAEGNIFTIKGFAELF